MTNNSIRVLVVDDEADTAFSMAELLELDGYHAVAATSGEEALKIADEQTFDAALLDVNMPGIDGAELAARLRQKFGGQMVLIAVSGHGDNSARSQKAIQNTDHFFTKPVKATDIKKIFRKV